MSKLFRYRKALEGKTNSPSNLIPSGLLVKALAVKEEPITYYQHFQNLFRLRKFKK